MFSAQDIKDLRASTGAGMLDCQKALKECDGNMEKAIAYLREKGIAAAAKKSSRIAAEGIVASFLPSTAVPGVDTFALSPVICADSNVP